MATKKSVGAFIISAILVAVLVVSLSLMGCAEPEATKPAIWRFTTNQQPGTFMWVDGYRPFCDTVEERTGGRLIIKPYLAGELGIDPANFLDVIKSGGVEMGEGNVSYYAETIEIFYMSQLPGLAATIDERVKVDDICAPAFDKVIQEKYNSKLFMIAPWPGCFIFSAKEIPNILDFRGVKIRAPGPSWEGQIINMGGDAFYMPTGEIYSGIEKGVIDGVTTSIDFTVKIKLYEQVDYVYMMQTGIGTYFTAVSLDAFNALSKDVQDILMEEFEKLRLTLIAGTKTLNERGLAVYKEEGVEIVYPTEAEIAEWEERAQMPMWAEAYATWSPETIALFNEICEAVGITYP